MLARGLTMPLRQIRVQTRFLEARGDARSESDRDARVRFRRVAQDVADFVFHAASVADGAALQPGLHIFFQVPYDKLSHRQVLRHFTDIMRPSPSEP